MISSTSLPCRALEMVNTPSEPLVTKRAWSLNTTLALPTGAPLLASTSVPLTPVAAIPWNARAISSNIVSLVRMLLLGIVP